jgi:hypothetical protein
LQKYRNVPEFFIQHNKTQTRTVIQPKAITMAHFSTIDLNKLTFEPMKTNKSGGKTYPIKVAGEYLKCQLAYIDEPLWTFGIQNSEKNKVTPDKKNMTITLSTPELQKFWEDIQSKIFANIEENSASPDYFKKKMTVEQMVEFEKVRRIVIPPSEEAIKKGYDKSSLKLKIALNTANNNDTKFFKYMGEDDNGEPKIEPIEFDDLPKGKGPGETAGFKCVPIVSVPSLYNVQGCMGASVKVLELVIIQGSAPEPGRFLSSNGKVSKVVNLKRKREEDDDTQQSNNTPKKQKFDGPQEVTDLNNQSPSKSNEIGGIDTEVFYP